MNDRVKAYQISKSAAVTARAQLTKGQQAPLFRIACILKLADIPVNKDTMRAAIKGWEFVTSQLPEWK